MLKLDTVVRDIVRARTSRAVPAEDDITFGPDGLGLDSISLAEVLLDCEDRFGVNVNALLDGEPLTLRRLLTHVKAHLEQELPA